MNIQITSLTNLFVMKFLKFLCLATACVAGSLAANAAVYRVNNQPGVDADFSDLTVAISTAVIDDTLYVEGSVISYGSITLNKRLNLIGAGFFIAANDSTQALPNSSRLDRLVISATASGSIITGIEVRNTSSSASSNPFGLVELASGANNVSLIRCYFYQSAAGTSNSFNGAALHLPTNVNNLVVSQCFIYQDRVTTNNSSCYGTYAVSVGSNCSGLVFANNIIKLGNKGTVYDQSCTQRAFSMSTSSSATIVSNVFIGRMDVFNSVFANNIQIIGSATATSSFAQNGNFPNVLQNNIGNSTQFGTTNGNQSNVNMNDVFAYAPGDENVDNHYRLKVGSPALGAGVSGIDCGAFGGDGAFKLSGLPAIPAIFQAVVPFQGNNADGINITIKSKTHE
jgi:hypothetical protein